MSLGRKHKKPEPKPLPKTLDDAIRFLIEVTPAAELEVLRQIPEEEVAHQTRLWQLGLRNTLGLWGTNRALLNSFEEKDRWGDNASHMIVMTLWKRLNADVTTQGTP
jgi:hypothetical protein